jgi:hypothetical protein
LLKFLTIECFSIGGGWISISFLFILEGHHNPCGAKPAGQSTIGLNLGNPAGNPFQAELAEAQEIATQSFGMGGKHSCRHEASGLVASPAQNSNGLAASGELMGYREAHESTTEDQHLLFAHG